MLPRVGKFAVAAALICLAVTATSCRGVKEASVVYVHDTIREEVHDTATVNVHDTTVVTVTKHDSIDRLVERTVYVDSNGVVHEKELERLVKYISEQSDEYRNKESRQESTIRELEQKLHDALAVKPEAKPLAWWQKTLMWLGAAFLLAVAGAAVYFVRRIKTGR